MDIPETKDVFLLTGAGFTKNFGGFLATEMWSQIFNDSRIQENQSLRSLLQDNFNFESVYSKVVDDEKYSEEEKDAIKGAVHDAYKRLDDVIRGWKFNSDSPHPVNIYGLNDLFQRLWPGPYTNPALFFTLNQDLFVERRWGHPSPGAPRFRQEFYQTHGRELDVSEFVTLPSEHVEDAVRGGLGSHNGIHYVKLHGSYGWRSSDGSNQLVIGTNKESLIQSEPLLSSYFDLLQSVIQQGNKKVLIIGYGFRDMHINKILLEGVQSHGLRVYILSPQSPEDLKYQIEHGHFYAKGIFDGLSGYFPYSLKEVFPGNQERTTHAEQILTALA